MKRTLIKIMVISDIICFIPLIYLFDGRNDFRNLYKEGVEFCYTDRDYLIATVYIFQLPLAVLILAIKQLT